MRVRLIVMKVCVTFSNLYSPDAVKRGVVSGGAKRSSRRPLLHLKMEWVEFFPRQIHPLRERVWPKRYMLFSLLPLHLTSERVFCHLLTPDISFSTPGINEV
jgi:hypothetical protein